MVSEHQQDDFFDSLSNMVSMKKWGHHSQILFQKAFIEHLTPGQVQRLLLSCTVSFGSHYTAIA